MNGISKDKDHLRAWETNSESSKRPVQSRCLALVIRVARRYIELRLPGITRDKDRSHVSTVSILGACLTRNRWYFARVAIDESERWKQDEVVTYM
jgi:hypothetical protein